MMGFQTNAWRRIVAVGLLAGFVPVASACFGSFQLTRKVYRFNQNVHSDKWIRWLVFLAATIIPVYPFAAGFDAIFANSVEFWTGNNPVARLEPGTVVGPNGEVARLVPVPGGAELTLVDASGMAHHATLLREAPGVVAAYDGEGRLVGRLTGVGTATPELAQLAAGR